MTEHSLSSHVLPTACESADRIDGSSLAPSSRRASAKKAGRATRILAAVGASVAVLAGCGLPERVVGLHNAPVEQTTGAAYSEAAAASIATRVLAASEKAFASSDKDAAARKATLVGPALRMAEVSNRFEDDSLSLTVRGEPQILGITAGRAWPRTILATTLASGVQRLHVIVADGPTSPYKLWVSAPMLPGTTLPAFPPLAEGIRVTAQGSDDASEPEKVLTAYGRLLDVPQKLKSSKTVSDDDAYAVAVKASSAAQKKALGSLGTFTRAHRAVAADTLVVGLADGSALSFGQLTRTDKLAPTSKAKRLDLPSDLAKLAGTKSVTKSLSLRWLLTVVSVIPAEGSAQVIGVGEQLRGISGS